MDPVQNKTASKFPPIKRIPLEKLELYRDSPKNRVLSSDRQGGDSTQRSPSPGGHMQAILHNQSLLQTNDIHQQSKFQSNQSLAEQINGQI